MATNGDEGVTRSVLRAELAEQAQHITEQLTAAMRQIETNLLTEFHRYAKGQQARMHTVEITESDFKLRLAALEDRILALEARRPPTV